jgi:hypothetical protein
MAAHIPKAPVDEMLVSIMHGDPKVRSKRHDTVQHTEFRQTSKQNQTRDHNEPRTSAMPQTTADANGTHKNKDRNTHGR